MINTETFKTDGDQWSASRSGRLTREEQTPDTRKQNVW